MAPASPRGEEKMRAGDFSQLRPDCGESLPGKASSWAALREMPDASCPPSPWSAVRLLTGDMKVHRDGADALVG